MLQNGLHSIKIASLISAIDLFILHILLTNESLVVEMHVNDFFCGLGNFLQ